MAQLERLRKGSNYRAGTVANVVIVYWSATATKASVLEVEGLLAALVAAQPGPVGFLVGVPQGTSAPDAATRDAFANSMKGHAGRLRASALLIEGTGLRPAANRAVITAISLLGDLSPMPHVCATAREAAGFLARQLDPVASAALAVDIEEAYQQLATPS